MPVISDVVAAEIADAPTSVQHLFAEILAYAPGIIGVSPEALQLADTYQQHTIINAIEMTRRIREQHAHSLQNATPEERIAFYREKARTMQVVVPTQQTLSARAPAKTQE